MKDQFSQLKPRADYMCDIRRCFVTFQRSQWTTVIPQTLIPDWSLQRTCTMFSVRYKIKFYLQFWLMQGASNCFCDSLALLLSVQQPEFRLKCPKITSFIGCAEETFRGPLIAKMYFEQRSKGLVYLGVWQRYLKFMVLNNLCLE